LSEILVSIFEKRSVRKQTVRKNVDTQIFLQKFKITAGWRGLKCGVVFTTYIISFKNGFCGAVLFKILLNFYKCVL